jgi:hypothetical protein
MLCQAEVRQELAQALGLDAAGQSTWTSPVYTCRYDYPAGALILTMRDLADPEAYLASRRNAGSADVPGLGVPAFARPDSILVVRRDNSVLEVDVSALPDPVGDPPRPRRDVAVAVAGIILHCWVEAGLS